MDARLGLGAKVALLVATCAAGAVTLWAWSRQLADPSLANLFALGLAALSVGVAFSWAVSAAYIYGRRPVKVYALRKPTRPRRDL
jgi:hypothetical protein